MAELLCRKKLQEAGLAEEYSTCSRSLSTSYEPENSPASQQGVEVCCKYFSLCIMIFIGFL